MSKTFSNIKIGDNFFIGINLLRKINENSAKLCVLKDNYFNIEDALNTKPIAINPNKPIIEFNSESKEIFNNIIKIKNYLISLNNFFDPVINNNITNDIKNIISEDINSINTKLKNEIKRLKYNLKNYESNIKEK